MKAILVLDKMPFDCWFCPLTCEHCDGAYQGRHPKCPLKPMPELKDEFKVDTKAILKNKSYEDGWNDCLKELEK